MLHILCAIYTSTYFRSGLVFMKGLGAVPVGGPVLVRLRHSLVKWRILWIWCTLKFTNFLNQISGQPWIKTQRRKFRQTEIFNLNCELKFWWFLAYRLYFGWWISRNQHFRWSQTFRRIENFEKSKISESENSKNQKFRIIEKFDKKPSKTQAWNSREFFAIAKIL